LLQKTRFAKDTPAYKTILNKINSIGTERLKFKFCDIERIASNFFIHLNLQNLENLIFLNSTFTKIERGAFNFISPKVKIHFDGGRVAIIRIFNNYLIINFNKLINCSKNLTIVGSRQTRTHDSLINWPTS
jgi:hypothetical protein